MKARCSTNILCPKCRRFVLENPPLDAHPAVCKCSCGFCCEAPTIEVTPCTPEGRPLSYDESFTATPIPRPLTSADWDSLPTASPLGDKQVAEMRRLFDSVPGTLPGLARSEERG